MFFFLTRVHKWRREESKEVEKEVGPDASDWPQSSWVIGRQDDGELCRRDSCSFLLTHCSLRLI